MKTRMRICSVTVLLVLGLVGLGVAQEAQEAEGRAPATSGMLGLRLIAWSELQKPQPVPQKPEPLPPPDGRQEPAQPSQTQNQPAEKSEQQSEPDSQRSTAQSITGTVVKISQKYVLETPDNLAYQLDDQERAKQYEGKHVKVMGTLDKTTGTIHIKSIELLS